MILNKGMKNPRKHNFKVEAVDFSLLNREVLLSLSIIRPYCAKKEGEVNLPLL